LRAITLLLTNIRRHRTESRNISSPSVPLNTRIMPSNAAGKAQLPPQSVIKFVITKKNKTGTNKTTRKRSKFDQTRRQQVKSVRKKRACLRCSLLRIKVSKACSEYEGPALINASPSAPSMIFAPLANNWLLITMRNKPSRFQAASGLDFLRSAFLNSVRITLTAPHSLEMTLMKHNYRYPSAIYSRPGARTSQRSRVRYHLPAICFPCCVGLTCSH
jgi:hypothetical protein